MVLIPRHLRCSPRVTAFDRPLATSLTASANFEDAETEANPGPGQQNPDPGSLALLADIRQAQGRLDEAIELYRRAQAAPTGAGGSACTGALMTTGTTGSHRRF